MKNLIFCHFSKIWKLNNFCDAIKSKLDQKVAKFVYYIPTVIKTSNSITIVLFEVSNSFFQITFLKL